MHLKETLNPEPEALQPALVAGVPTQSPRSSTTSSLLPTIGVPKWRGLLVPRGRGLQGFKYGLGFRLDKYCLGFRVYQGLGFRVYQGLGFRVH